MYRATCGPFRRLANAEVRRVTEELNVAGLPYAEAKEKLLKTSEGAGLRRVGVFPDQPGPVFDFPRAGVRVFADALEPDRLVAEPLDEESGWRETFLELDG